MILSAGSSERNVVSREEYNPSLRKDSVVLDLRLPDGGAVIGENDELGLSGSERAKGRLVTQHVLATLDDETELVADVLGPNLFNHSLFIIILN